MHSSFPILSEEGNETPYAVREKWDRFWIVDPLDGTREFIDKNDAFTVNICLIENNNPIVGIIYAPALQCVYVGSPKWGGYYIESCPSKMEEIKRSQIMRLHPNIHQLPPIIVGSRSHRKVELEDI